MLVTASGDENTLPSAAAVGNTKRVRRAQAVLEGGREREKSAEPNMPVSFRWLWMNAFP